MNSDDCVNMFKMGIYIYVPWNKKIEVIEK